MELNRFRHFWLSLFTWVFFSVPCQTVRLPVSLHFRPLKFSNSLFPQKKILVSFGVFRAKNKGVWFKTRIKPVLTPGKKTRVQSRREKIGQIFFGIAWTQPARFIDFEGTVTDPASFKEKDLHSAALPVFNQTFWHDLLQSAIFCRTRYLRQKRPSESANNAFLCAFFSLFHFGLFIFECAVLRPWGASNVEKLTRVKRWASINFVFSAQTTTKPSRCFYI